MNFVFIKRFLILVVSLFIWFIIHTIFVIIDGLNDELKPDDAAVGKEGFDEAKVMKSYLIDKGIPEVKIIEDNNGYNSYMTARNTSKIMDELELDSVMVITQYFHVSRTKLAFRKMDIKEVYSAHAKIIFEFRDIYSIIREFPAYYKYLFK